MAGTARGAAAIKLREVVSRLLARPESPIPPLRGGKVKAHIAAIIAVILTNLIANRTSCSAICRRLPPNNSACLRC
jgi:hypothetical protein